MDIAKQALQAKVEERDAKIRQLEQKVREGLDEIDRRKFLEKKV